ncbi:hypothetical protein [Rhodospirillaceae bacterium SYSU D60014]|uniref:hypothetical protein n=1 Tax=Virgifigura deserti TaxID=2268457 RepID=UPI000E6754CC
MIRPAMTLAAGLMALSLPACAQDYDSAPPGGDYKAVSSLVPLPDFIPGLGTLYVQPDTLPAGPFLAYDKEGGLVSTVYMIPMEDVEAQKEFDGLQAASQPVDHVDLYYNAGHPGVEKPHYHIILWHVSEDEAKKLQ